jgi:hypothetical protein
VAIVSSSEWLLHVLARLCGYRQQFSSIKTKYERIALYHLLLKLWDPNMVMSYT